MNKAQTNRKEMYDAVDLFLDGNASTWSSIPKFVEFKTRFTGLRTLIETVAGEQQDAQTFLGKNKTQLKQTVAVKADVLNDALEAMALLNGDDKLAARMSDSYSGIYRLRNLDFITKVREIIQAADDNSGELTTNYGVTIEQIDDLKADADRFAEMNGMPRAYRVASVQATLELESLFTEINEVLTTGLDKIMAIFRRRDPNFYNGYQAARVVVDN